MSSPPPVDPYLALGVSKDADLSTIRGAHRKLILKFHPDRIKDEAERVKGREEFQKVQQAYELLSDPAKRSRYDDKVRLAELRKEAFGRELPTRASTYPSRPPQFSAAAREFRDGHYYEERVPTGAAFFEEEDRFREEPPRASVRKGDNYERKTSATYTEKKSTGWKAGGFSIDIAMKMQKRAASAKEKVKERDVRAAAAKSRDQERRREASDKQNSRRAYVEDDLSSDSDTATYASINRKPANPISASSTPRRSKSDQSRKKEFDYSDDEDDWSRDKHQDLHASARDYIQRSASDRPRPIHRQDSSHSYFEPRDDRSYPRRSGSDREDRRKDRDRDRERERERERERPKSSRSRRPSYSEIDIPRDVRPRKMPAMPTGTSAPANLKIPEDRRDAPQPHRATTTQPVRDHRKELPPMPRSNTMPSTGSARRSDNAPSRGSNLKHAETQDSGYGSSSPATPDLSGTSPPKYAPATRYQIVDEAEEYSCGHRTILVEPEDSNRRTRSPSREQQRPTLSTSGARTKASRAATAYTPRPPVDLPPVRPSATRHESTRSSAQSRDLPHLSRSSTGQRERKPLYREVSSDEQDSGYKHRSSSEKIASPRVRAQDAYNTSRRGSRDQGRDEDYYPGSNYRSELRHPGMGSRRPSVC
jgi:curved DNA-binding protein CbpA